VAGRWFSPGTPMSSTSKTDRHDITEILLKVALHPITLTPTSSYQEIYISLISVCSNVTLFYFLYISAIVFVYDFHGGAETLMARHFNNPGSINGYNVDARGFNPAGNAKGQ